MVRNKTKATFSDEEIGEMLSVADSKEKNDEIVNSAMPQATNLERTTILKADRFSQRKGKSFSEKFNRDAPLVLTMAITLIGFVYLYLEYFR